MMWGGGGVTYPADAAALPGVPGGNSVKPPTTLRAAAPQVCDSQHHGNCEHHGTSSAHYPLASLNTRYVEEERRHADVGPVRRVTSSWWLYGTGKWLYNTGKEHAACKQ